MLRVEIVNRSARIHCQGAICSHNPAPPRSKKENIRTNGLDQYAVMAKVRDRSGRSPAPRLRCWSHSLAEPRHGERSIGLPLQRILFVRDGPVLLVAIRQRHAPPVERRLAPFVATAPHVHPRRTRLLNPMPSPQLPCIAEAGGE